MNPGSWMPRGASVASSTAELVVEVPHRQARRVDLEVEQRPVRVCHPTIVATSRTLRCVGFTRAELESFRDATVPDLIGPGLKLLFVGINPGPLDRGDADPLRPPRQPLLPGAAAGRRDRARDRPRHRHVRRRPRAPRRPRHRHHQPRAARHGEGVRADGSRAARGRRAAAPHGSRAPAAGRRRRRHHRLSSRVRIEDASNPAGSPSRSRAPSCGWSRTRAASTPTRRSRRWPPPTEPQPLPPACSDAGWCRRSVAATRDEARQQIRT